MGDDEHAMVQLVTSGGQEFIPGFGYTFQLQDGSQVLIRADSKLSDAGKSEEPSSALSALDSQDSCGASQTLVLDAVPDSPPDSGHVVVEPSAAATVAAVEAASGGATGRRRVAVVLSEEGVATAVPLHSVVEAGLSQRVLFQEDGQPVILEVLDQDADSAAAEGNDPGQASSWADDDGSQSWFSGTDRAAADGRIMKTGMWSREEVDTLSANMEQYCRDRGINNPEDIIFRCSKDERKNFYRTVARGINRPLFSIYRRIIRMYDHKNHVGRYTDEEVEQLRNLRAIHGNKWQTIGALMGRSAASVKDRVRVLRDNCNQGKWLKEEEERLEQAVHELIRPRPGQQVTSGINWAAVAQKVITRSEKQCRSKWLNNLSWKTMGGEEWTREDDKHLIDVLAESAIAEEGEIDWSSLTEMWPRNSVRSPQWLRGRWWTLKQQLKNHQRLGFREVLAGLLSSEQRSSLRPRGAHDSPAEPEPAGGDDAPDSPPVTNAPQPLIPPGARVFVDQEGRVIPGSSLAVQEDGTYVLDSLAEVGFPGAAVMIAGQLYTTLPHQLPAHLLVPAVAAGGDQVVLEPPAAPLLHHAGVSLQADEPAVALVSAPALPDAEFSDEARLSQQSHTSVIRGDPIMSRTAPGATSEEDESLDCPQ